MKERVKFKDLYNLYQNNWVGTVNDKWKNKDIDTSEIYGVYETEEDMLKGIKEFNPSGFTLWRCLRW